MITSDNIHMVVERIVSNFQPQKIILFGSYAHGSPTEESDLDLLIIKNSTVPKIQRNRQIRRILNDLYFPVDVFVKTEREYDRYKDVIGTVVYSAHKYGKVIYGE